MERRAASHTEEEEMNQRRRLLNLARKGDPKAISKLFELYQVRVLSGEMLNKINRAAKISATHDKTGHRGKGKPSAARKPSPPRKPSRARAKQTSPKRSNLKRPKPKRSKASHGPAKKTVKRNPRHR